MKQFKLLMSMLILLLFIVSCETEDETTPQISEDIEEQTDSILSLYGGWWYIDTVYNQSAQNLMLLTSQKHKRTNITIDKDTIWTESSTKGTAFDTYTLYLTKGDTLFWQPQVDADAWKAMVIDSLTPTRLHFRVVNTSPNATTANFAHQSLLHYEYKK